MEESVDRIVGLWTSYSKVKTDNEQIRYLTTEIMSFINESKNVVPVLVAISQTTNDSIRLIGYTSFLSMMRMHKTQFDEETIEFIDSIIYEIIQQEPQAHQRKILVEQLCLVYYFGKKIEKFGKLVAFATSLMENSDYLSTSIWIWVYIFNICPEKTDDFKDYICSTLLPVLVNCFSATSSDIRIASYSLLPSVMALFEESISEELKDQIGNELVSISQQLFTNISDSLESSEFFRHFNDIIECSPEFVGERCKEVFDIAAQYVVESSIDIMVRSSCVIIFHQISKFLPMIIHDDLDIYIKNIVFFSIELCKENPEDNSYFIGFDFFKESSRYLIEEGNPLDVFLPIISELFQNEDCPSFQVSFMLLESVLDSSVISVMEMYDDIVPIIKVSLESGNTPLIDECCKFIQELVREAQSLAPQIQNSFEELLLMNAENDVVLDCLASVYEISQLEPADSNNTLQILLEQFSSPKPEHHEAIVQVINSVLRTIDSIDESVYNVVKPYLEELLQVSNSARGKALSCFSAFASTTPKLLLPDLHLFVPELIASIDQTNDQLCSDALLTAQNLFAYYNVSLSDYHVTFFEKALDIIKLYKEDEDGHPIMEAIEPTVMEFGNTNDEDDDDEYQRIQTQISNIIGSAIEFCAFLFVTYPESLRNHSEDLLKMIISFVEKENFYMASSVFLAVQDTVNGCVQIGVNVKPLIDIMIEESSSLHEKSMLESLWSSLCYCCRCLDKPTLEEVAPVLMEKVSLIICGEIPIYNQNPRTKKLDKELIRPMLDLIEEFFIKMGPLSRPYVSGLTKGLNKMLNDKLAIVSSSAARTYAVISNAIPELQDIQQQVIEYCFNNLQTTIAEVQGPIFISLNYLMEIIPDAFHEQAQSLYKLTYDIISSPNTDRNLTDSAVILWGSLVRSFNMVPSTEELKTVMSLMPMKMNNYMLRFSAQFAVYAMNNWEYIANEHILRIATNIIGSDDHTLRAIIPDDLSFMIDIIVKFGEAETASISRFNENILYNIRRHITDVNQ